MITKIYGVYLGEHLAIVDEFLNSFSHQPQPRPPGVLICFEECTRVFIWSGRFIVEMLNIACFISFVPNSLQNSTYRFDTQNISCIAHFITGRDSLAVLWAWHILVKFYHILKQWTIFCSILCLIMARRYWSPRLSHSAILCCLRSLAEASRAMVDSYMSLDSMPLIPESNGFMCCCWTSKSLVLQLPTC